MSRPFKCRRVAFVPDVTYFKPAGIPLRDLAEIQLTVEELEALRLKDLEGLEQEQGAEKMNVSRQTFQRVLAAARQKVADALLNGKAISIGGGNFEVSTRRCQYADGNERENPTDIRKEEKEGTNMKIAVITEDGKTISKHFGMAPYYMVVTLEDGKIVTKEQRNKAGHHTFGDNPHAAHAAPGEKHGYDAESHSKHATMAEAMADSKVLIAGGMGWGAYDSLKRLGIETIITDVGDIEEAVKLYAQGKLANLASERLH
jgi:predicted DNA-binding protein (UPF0251 family)/predicted Fe-Mo cluster-binding NifX family protein